MVKTCPQTKTDTDLPDTTETTYNRKYRLGMMLHDPMGGIWKYGKISFGRCSESEIRFYQWIPWNAASRFQMLNVDM